MCMRTQSGIGKNTEMGTCNFSASPRHKKGGPPVLPDYGKECTSSSVNTSAADSALPPVIQLEAWGSTVGGGVHCLVIALTLFWNAQHLDLNISHFPSIVSNLTAHVLYCTVYTVGWVDSLISIRGY